MFLNCKCIAIPISRKITERKKKRLNIAGTHNKKIRLEHSGEKSSLAHVGRWVLFFLRNSFQRGNLTVLHFLMLWTEIFVIKLRYILFQLLSDPYRIDISPRVVVCP